MTKDKPQEINSAQAFAILSEAYAEQTVELRVLRTQLVHALRRVEELTPKKDDEKVK